MKPAFLLTFLTLIITITCAAQQTTITGFVRDENGLPVGSVTMSLQKAKDSSLVKTDLADQNGSYKFDKIAPCKYFVTASAAGFRKTSSPQFEVVQDKAHEVPVMMLSKSSASLAEVRGSGKITAAQEEQDRAGGNN